MLFCMLFVVLFNVLPFQHETQQMLRLSPQEVLVFIFNILLQYLISSTMTFTRVTQAVLLYALLGVITSLPVRYLNCLSVC